MTARRLRADGQRARNRRVALVLLFVAGALALATLLAGIRW
jgi:hypothetical protein